MKYKYWMLIPLSSLLLLSCNDDDDPEPTNSTTVTLVRDLPADPTVVPNTPGTGKFTLFRFSDNQTVTSADSATNNWDVGFNSTTIIVNGGTSGPGSTVAQVVNGIFDELHEAPETGYKTDNKLSLPPNAIVTGSGQGWYNYNSTTHIISAIPGRVLVFRTTEGKYVKVEILSYYQGAPATPDDNSVARYYTFRYYYQPDGTRKFN